MAIPTIILVRHGETSLNKPGMMRGWTDVPLDSSGIKMARQTAKEVAKEWPVAKLYSGDLKRQVQSANFLAGETGLRLEERFSLRPWNGGELVGKKVSNLESKLRHYIDNPNEAPKDGETMNDFTNRLMQFMTEVFQEATYTSPIVVVTSIRPIEAIIGYIEDSMRAISPERLEAKKETVGPSGVVVLTNPKKRDDWKYKIWKANKPRNEGQS